MTQENKEPTLIGTKTLTHSENKKDKILKIKTKKSVVIFLIGGAADKREYLGTGPNNNILDVEIELKNNLLTNKIPQEAVHIVYLGYYEIFGVERIKQNVINKIKDKNDIVCIIGHSLGGWNGAHLSNSLSGKGYNVDLLITLDPVGVGAGVRIGSDIYFYQPEPKAKYWINLKYEQSYIEIINNALTPSRKHDKITDTIPNIVADAGGK